MLVTILFASCDDGDIVADAINFGTATVKVCPNNNLLYKISDNQSMIFEFDQSSTVLPFKNEVGVKPLLTIDNLKNKLIYRTYNGNPLDTSICGTILDPNPTISQQWVAEYGSAEITTSTVLSILNASNNSTRITKYNHAVVFKNIGWKKSDGTIQQEAEITYGVIQTNPDYTLAFGFDSDPNTDVIKSTCGTSIFNFSGREALHLKLDPATYNQLFTNVASSNSKTALISNTNTLTYSLFNDIINNAYFCATPLPSYPILLEEWKAENGVSDIKGTISVNTSTQTSTQFKHSITLKGVTFKKGNVTFYYGDTIDMGSFVTP